MTTDAPELKPCPFCGGEATCDTHGQRTGCPRCGVWVHRIELTASRNGEVMTWNKQAEASVWNARADLAKPRVKPLVWREYGCDYDGFTTDVLGLEYTVTFEDGTWGWMEHSTGNSEIVDGDAGEAKAAAQADYERRIMEALQ